MKFLLGSVFIAFVSRGGRREDPATDSPPAPDYGPPGPHNAQQNRCDASVGEQNCPADPIDHGYILAPNGNQRHRCPEGYEGVPGPDCVIAFGDFACSETKAGRPRCIWGHGSFVINDEFELPGCSTNTEQGDTQGWNPKYNNAVRFARTKENKDHQRLCRPVTTTITTSTVSTTSSTTHLDLTGTYTIVQKKTGRFMDAHLSSGDDWSVVTRGDQGDDTQKWIFKWVGGIDATTGIYTIQQKKNNRYLDAYLEYSSDWDVVTRGVQENDSQKWIVSATAADGVYRIQQKTNNRYLDAWENSRDHRVVTREDQSDTSQDWKLEKVNS